MADSNNSSNKTGAANASQNRFLWNIEMVKDLLDSLYEYKIQMDYQNVDFNADKAKQYQSVRKILSAIVC